MLDRDALSTRLAALETYLREIRSLAKHDREEFAATPALHHLAERHLHLACECVLDTAHHVIAEMGYRQPESYRDAMDVLRENGHLDEPLAERLKAWVGLRNVLVRFYLTVDHERVHDAMRNDLGGLTAFAQRMAPLLGGDVPG